MKKQDLDFIQEKLNILLGQPLRSICRGGGSIFIGFGEPVEKDSAYFTEDGKATVRKTMSDKYALHIECGSRFICGDEIIFAKRDMFLPSTSIENQPAFDWDTFEWDARGNNLFDEKANHYLGDKSFDFIVKRIIPNQWGDLKICFENDFVLEIFSDVSENEECWRFFAVNSTDDHLVVTAQGIEKECDLLDTVE